MAQSSSAESANRGEQSAPVVGGHTPTPWRAVRNDYYLEIHGGGHGQIGDVCASKFIHVDGNKLPSDEAEAIADANAAFIVRACNSHDALVKALKEIAALDGHAYRSFELIKRARHIAKCALSARGVQ